MATEKRLIDANALLLEIEEELAHESLFFTTEQSKLIDCGLRIAAVDIRHQPTVDAVEVVHGRWVKHPKPVYMCGDLYYRYECSNCGKDRFVICGEDRIYAKYCEECGAKMGGGNEEAQPDCTYNKNGHCIGQKLMPECDAKNCDRRK